jgi:hypothetical protein
MEAPAIVEDLNVLEERTLGHLARLRSGVVDQLALQRVPDALHPSVIVAITDTAFAHLDAVPVRQ